MWVVFLIKPGFLPALKQNKKNHYQVSQCDSVKFVHLLKINIRLVMNVLYISEIENFKVEFIC